MKKTILITAMLLVGVVQNVNAQNRNYEYNVSKIASIVNKASYVGEFSEGFLNVKINDKWGYINYKGEVVTSFEYDHANPFSCGMARVEKTDQNQSGFVNVKGEFVTNEYLRGAHVFHDGLAVTVGVSYNNDGQYGIVNKQGKLIVPYQSNIIYDYEDGMAVVCVDRSRYGAYNIYGQLAVPTIYDGIRSFNCGLAGAQIGSEQFYVRKDGTRLKPSLLKYGNDFKDNIASVETKEGRGFMDVNGRIIVFQSLSEWCELYCNVEDFSEGFAVVHDCELDGPTKKGFMNKLGKVVVPIVYDEAYAFKNGMAKVAKNGRYGFVNTDGRLVVDCIYDDAIDYSDGIGIIKQNGKYGYINKQGNLVGQINFDEVKPFAFGIAKVERSGKIGFIDKKGNCTLDCTVSDNISTDVEVSASKQTEAKTATYVGGETAMRRFIASILRYPVIAEENGEQGTVVVGFTVEEDGSLTNIHIEKSVSEWLDKEAKRIVSKMPNWQPAQSGGVNVKSEQTVIVNFRLQ